MALWIPAQGDWGQVAFLTTPLLDRNGNPVPDPEDPTGETIIQQITRLDANNTKIDDQVSVVVHWEDKIVRSEVMDAGAERVFVFPLNSRPTTLNLSVSITHNKA